jgi:hypothetical protein
MVTATILSCLFLAGTIEAGVVMKRIIHRPVNPPLCACGCNQPVKLIWGRKIWNKYIQGHFIRTKTWHDNMSKAKKKYFELFANPMQGMHHSEESNEENRKKHTKRHITRPLIAPQCACGCGSNVTRNKYQNWKWNRFLKGHSGHTPEDRKKQASSLRKHVRSEWHCKNLSTSQFGRITTPETSKKLSISHTGLIRTPTHCKNISLALLGKPKSFGARWNMAKAQMGSLNHLWRGGTSFLPYNLDWTDLLRKQIKERDGCVCQNPLCKNGSKLLQVHHIDYNKKNNDPKNLITLCGSCHGKTTSGNREYWTKFYQEKFKCV